MAYIHIPRRHLLQPQGRVKVASAWEPRLASLLYFGYGGQPVDLIDRAANYVLTGAAITSCRNGLGLKTAISGMQYAESSGAMANYSGNFTLAMYFDEFGATQDANGGMMFAIPAASQYTQITSSGQIFFAGQGPYGLPTDPRGTQNTSIVLRGAGSDPAFFVGRQRSTGATASIASGSKTVRVGAWSGAGWQFAGTYGSIAVIKGEISDAEAYELVDSPWLFYSADPVRFYSFPSGAITLTSLTMSNFTSSTARATLSLTR